MSEEIKELGGEIDSLTSERNSGEAELSSEQQNEAIRTGPVQARGDEAKEESIDTLPIPEPEEEEKEHEKSWPKGFKDRLKRQDRHLQEAQNKAALLEQRLNEALIERTAGTTQPISADAPKRVDFDSDDDYFDARYAYKQKKEYEEAQKSRANIEYSREIETIAKRQKEIDEKGFTKYPDYAEVVHDNLFVDGFPPNRAMYEAITESNYATDMLYFLGKYPEEARKIALMKPVQAVKKIAEIEMRYKTRANSAKTTRAPAPIGDSKSSGTAITGNPANFSPEDYRKWRESARAK